MLPRELAHACTHAWTRTHAWHVLAPLTSREALTHDILRKNNKETWRRDVIVLPPPPKQLPLLNARRARQCWVERLKIAVDSSAESGLQWRVSTWYIKPWLGNDSSVCFGHSWVRDDGIGPILNTQERSGVMSQPLISQPLTQHSYLRYRVRKPAWGAVMGGLICTGRSLKRVAKSMAMPLNNQEGSGVSSRKRTATSLNSQERSQPLSQKCTATSLNSQERSGAFEWKVYGNLTQQPRALWSVEWEVYGNLTQQPRVLWSVESKLYGNLNQQPKALWSVESKAHSTSRSALSDFSFAVLCLRTS